MPFLEVQGTGGKKRKRTDPKRVTAEDDIEASSSKRSTKRKDVENEIKRLEAGILESRRNYNNIAELVSIAKVDGDSDTSISASVALCRVFSLLMAGGSMTKSRTTAESELVIIKWLRSQYAEYTETLLNLLSHREPQRHEIAVELLMRLTKEESAHLSNQGDQVWKLGTFANAMRQMLESSTSPNPALDCFTRSYLVEYDDIRYWTFGAITTVINNLAIAEDATEHALSNPLALLLALEPPTESGAVLSKFHGQAPENPKHGVYSLIAHKNEAQKAWLAVLQADLTKEQRKEILLSMTQRVVPWFIKVDLLMDFLTSSFDEGGATSLLALSGLFTMIQERNLDYPAFYAKLYSLLDGGILHSKHRSRFFRLLDTFMESSHLPAQLVASFIKRLSRLSLQAPPAGIVMVVPWIYNMFKKHPQCTYMVHRETHDPDDKESLEAEGMDDPFDMNEPDPMMTNAIESSLWEIVTLQSHYHPNVATLAKIISEQFTKQSYNLEDFLDHSYNSLIEAELGKELKKAPVVEWQIPKRIFLVDDADAPNNFGILLDKAMGLA
ncbi:CBF-domain-containing protein [Rhizodiscina lignyota]|uniref:CBF-domain-containing protein n=1 Tax=Rhizodiscina lignyota TaxID=1504668 RepID=A0A9P4IA69_9PEZI|nr:CBF-domain-containing protein [Rhizodiscina lignyota]